jgi:hypothetical protein
MGRIILETNSTTYELERSDEDVLAFFQSLTGIKVALKGQTEKPEETIEQFVPSGGKSFKMDTLPSREDIINYIKSHLDGFSISMSLEHFYGYAPKYGISKEQNRLIGTYSARVKRARESVEKSKGGKFELENVGGIKLFVFKKNPANS